MEDCQDVLTELSLLTKGINHLSADLWGTEIILPSNYQSPSGGKDMGDFKIVPNSLHGLNGSFSLHGFCHSDFLFSPHTQGAYKS